MMVSGPNFLKERDMKCDVTLYQENMQTMRVEHVEFEGTPDDFAIAIARHLGNKMFMSVGGVVVRADTVLSVTVVPAED